VLTKNDLVVVKTFSNLLWNYGHPTYIGVNETGIATPYQEKLKNTFLFFSPLYLFSSTVFCF
jgi:hypothetical protein